MKNRRRVEVVSFTTDGTSPGNVLCMQYPIDTLYNCVTHTGHVSSLKSIGVQTKALRTEDFNRYGTRGPVNGSTYDESYFYYTHVRFDFNKFKSDLGNGNFTPEDFNLEKDLLNLRSVPVPDFLENQILFAMAYPHHADTIRGRVVALYKVLHQKKYIDESFGNDGCTYLVKTLIGDNEFALSLEATTVKELMDLIDGKEEGTYKVYEVKECNTVGVE